MSDWLVLARHELFLFAASFFLLGAIDEFAVDVAYLWLRLTGRARTPRVVEAQLAQSPLAGPCAVFIPTWRESRVIGTTIAHALSVWPHVGLRLYVGCYRNDPATIAAVAAAAPGDPRLRIVILERDGPTCKADCLNRLFEALKSDEARQGKRARMVVLHDAEDMVDPAALGLLDRALDHADFVQLPVMALPQARSRWIAGHYTDEFAEAHAKTMVARGALGAGTPGAGVGCAIGRDWLDRLVSLRGSTLGHSAATPFATGALTEDYELGLQLGVLGARTLFLRVRTEGGRLIATRAYFPARLDAAVRQKARWIHGIALQGWDRLGWRGGVLARWMQLRDRRGPLAAVLLASAYLLVIVAALDWGLEWAGLARPLPLSGALKALLWANLAALVWRAGARALFTAREYGPAEGLRAIPRIVVSNTIAIVAGRRALFAYARTLSGALPAWDKTDHADHPVLAAPAIERAR